jgi:hypothetical protein
VVLVVEPVEAVEAQEAFQVERVVTRHSLVKMVAVWGDLGDREPVPMASLEEGDFFRTITEP